VNNLQLFLPCPAGVEDMLAVEVAKVLGEPIEVAKAVRGGVRVEASWREVMQLNLHVRLAQRVLVQLADQPYHLEDDIYAAANDVAWEAWFTPRESFRVDITAQHSPLKSLNFAALRVKDGVVDRLRSKCGTRPDVNTSQPHVRVHAHLDATHVTLYIDTSGEPLFKRGWREDKGDAPLKETLAAAMIAATGWDGQSMPLYDPCCGSGTVAIEAAQIACNMAAGMQRRFGFANLLPFQAHVWDGLLDQAHDQVLRGPSATGEVLVFGSDVSHRMVDFATRNAHRAGVTHAIQLRGGDALQRTPPIDKPGILLLNPPYGERIAAAGVAGERAADRAHSRGQHERTSQASAQGGRVWREAAQVDGGQDSGEGDAFFDRLATHWKQHFAGWQAWLLTPDMKLPGKMRMKAARRVPMWNGPIECRLFRFDLTAMGKRHGE
jgi:putative N6-adenine-specific DNA methylase